LTVGKGASSISTNTAVGVSALAAITTGSGNTAVGNTAGAAIVTGSSNSFFGYNAGRINTANQNSFFGTDVGYQNTTGTKNSYFGYRSGHYSIDGQENSYFGYQSGFLSTSGGANSSFGYQAGYDVLTGGFNTILGYNTGRGITTGNYNTIIGSQVTGLSSSLANHTILADGQGNMRLVSFNDGNVYIGGTTSLPTNSGYKLDVNGTARVREYLYMVRQDGAATIDALRYVTGGTIDIGTTFRVLGTNTWSANTGSTAYIQNNFGSKVFASQPNQNGNFTINDFQTTGLSPTIPAGYNQKVIGSSFLISSTAVNNFFGLDIRATDNSSSIANNVYAIYADATLGTNTSANRWAGYFVGNGYFSGNVGIGTTSPSSKLHVVTGNVDGLRVESSNSGYIELGKTASNRWRWANDYTSAGLLELQYGNNTTPTTTRFKITSDGNADFSSSASSGYGLYTNRTIGSGLGAQFAVSSGNVLIGTTTDAGYKLDVNGTVRVQGTELRLDNGTTGVINLYSATPSIQFFSGDPTGYRLYRSSTNMFLNSGGAFFLQISGNDAYSLNAANGHIWRTALSGGAALMRLDTGGSLSIGNASNAANASSILDLTSTTKGFLPPRMTNAQITAIASPAAGLVVYSTTALTLAFYNGTSWRKVTDTAL
jgi:hypothetical protein